MKDDQLAEERGMIFYITFRLIVVSQDEIKQIIA
jgi:hypothetical protein